MLATRHNDIDILYLIFSQIFMAMRIADVDIVRTINAWKAEKVYLETRHEY